MTVHDEAPEARERAAREAKGKRGYDLRDVETEATSEDRFWVDLCAIHEDLSDEEVEQRLYKPRRLSLRHEGESARLLDVLLPLDGASPEDLLAWRRRVGDPERSLIMEIRRVGGLYYGSKTYHPGPELLPPEPSAQLAAPQAQASALAPTPESTASGLELLARKLLSPEGPAWAQQMVALVGGAGMQLVLVYKEQAAEAEEKGRVRAQYNYVLNQEQEQERRLARMEELRLKADAELRALEETHRRIYEAQRASHAPVLPISPPAAAPSYAPQTSPQAAPQGVPAPAGVPAYAR